MQKTQIQEIIHKLIADLEEEDIGISLLSVYTQNKEELGFFPEEEGKRVVSILKVLSDDSHRHKRILEKIIHLLNEKIE